MNKFFGILFIVSFALFSSSLFAYGENEFGVKRYGGSGGKWNTDNHWGGHGNHWQPPSYNDSISFEINMNHSGDSDVTAETKGYGDEGHGESFTESTRDVTSEAGANLTLFPSDSGCGGPCGDNKAFLKHHMESTDTAKAMQWSSGEFQSGSNAGTAVDNWYEAGGSLEIDRD